MGVRLVVVKTILAIETSVPQASVALWKDGEVVFEEGFMSDRRHNSMIFSPLEKALRAVGDEGLDGILVGTGPGSYSGTRVGIAAAQGVAISHGCPAVGLGSLGGVREVREAVSAGRSAVALGDARRGLYYVSQITGEGEAMDAELMDAGDFVNRVEDAQSGLMVTLDELERLGLPSRLSSQVVRVLPEARYLLDLWLALSEERKGALVMRPLSPSYLRAPFTSKAKGGHPLLR